MLKKVVNEYLMVAQEVEFAKHQGKTPDQASVDKIAEAAGHFESECRCSSIFERSDSFPDDADGRY
mgnify:CR=1 FL=1